MDIHMYTHMDIHLYIRMDIQYKFGYLVSHGYSFPISGYSQ